MSSWLAVSLKVVSGSITRQSTSRRRGSLATLRIEAIRPARHKVAVIRVRVAPGTVRGGPGRGVAPHRGIVGRPGAPPTPANSGVSNGPGIAGSTTTPRIP